MPEQRLPRYLDELHERITWERKLARILIAVGEPAPRGRAGKRIATAARKATPPASAGCLSWRAALAAQSPEAIRWPPCWRRSGTASGAPKTVVCRDCGDSFELSARNEYGWRKRGLQPVCGDCRRPPKPPSEADRRYWTARFTMDEIRAMGCAIWPEV